MSYFPKITILALVFFATLGLAISLQEVFGINIGSDLNFALTGKKITGLPVPVASSDAATKGYVDSVIAGSDSGGLYGVCEGVCGCPAGSISVLISAPTNARRFYSCYKP